MSHTGQSLLQKGPYYAAPFLLLTTATAAVPALRDSSGELN